MLYSTYWRRWGFFFHSLHSTSASLCQFLHFPGNQSEFVAFICRLYEWVDWTITAEVKVECSQFCQFKELCSVSTSKQRLTRKIWRIFVEINWVFFSKTALDEERRREEIVIFSYRNHHLLSNQETVLKSMQCVKAIVKYFGKHVYSLRVRLIVACLQNPSKRCSRQY